MNEEKWVLAVLKRKLVELKNNAGDKFSYDRDIYAEVLEVIATAESDAILGTQELVAELVDKLPDTLPGGDTDCADCQIDFGEVDI